MGLSVNIIVAHGAPTTRLLFSYCRCPAHRQTPKMQVSIPALFMLLLVWIKSLTTVFDSPAAAYTCGQTIPWQYEESLNPATIVETPLFQCLQKPPNCSADNYYRDEGGMFEQMGLEGVGLCTSVNAICNVLWMQYGIVRLTSKTLILYLYICDMARSADRGVEPLELYAILHCTIAYLLHCQEARCGGLCAA